MPSRRGYKTVWTICKKQCVIKTAFVAISSMHRGVFRTLSVI